MRNNKITIKIDFCSNKYLQDKGATWPVGCELEFSYLEAEHESESLTPFALWVTSKPAPITYCHPVSNT